MQQFEEIHQYLPNILGLGGILVSLMLGTIIETNIHFSGKKVNKWLKAMPIVTGMVFAIICGVYLFHSTSANEQAFENNVKQKYAVDEVYIHYNGNHVTVENTEVQSVYVSKDGSIYEFYVTQDKTTWEPTLTPAPVEDTTVKQWEQPEAPKR